ncbi:hypothetical protein AAFF_G00080370 [Aldrovandia affinis]|uniref:Caskin C-terminal domain-containing protein n=1 Tax=Aldrovandia affinis TaxID=143900 RepID=A0AAD7T3I4_9TELE|nr:hypothetical protein AAFF_G00080370 [Aldrovandia affinis]
MQTAYLATLHVHSQSSPREAPRWHRAGRGDSKPPRTISGPVTGLVTAARRERGPREPQSAQERLAPEPLPGSAGSSAESLPFASDGNLTIRQRPRQGRGDGDSLADRVYSLPQEELSRMDATATLKRRVRPKHHQDGVKFQLTESSTVKRRPKSKDKDSGETLEGQLFAPYQNGTSTVKRRPVSEMSGVEPPRPQDNGDAAPRRDSADFGSHGVEAEPRKPIKPPVSPKPVLAQQMKKQGPPAPSAKRVPIPGPGGPGGPEVKRVPPPVSPKPSPPPTAPKPAKVLQSISVTPPSTPTPGKQAAGTPSSLSTGPARPHTPPAQTPQTPGTPLTPGPTPPPVKPPRSSISGVSVDITGPVEAAQQKLEETSASLAAALQAVEEKIKQEDGQKESVAEDKSTVSILDDIGSMFDDLADQLDAMLE